jgi:hypothetical protein
MQGRRWGRERRRCGELRFVLGPITLYFDNGVSGKSHVCAVLL